MSPKMTQQLCQSEPIEEELLTPAQVAGLLQMDVRGVHRLARNGEGPPPVQVSRNIRRWTRRGVQDWIAANTRSEVSE